MSEKSSKHKIPGVTECHHIIPRCLGGTDEEDNLIHLYPKDHFEAHRLLWLENPENVSLQYAFWMMINTREGIVDADEYQRLRTLHSQAASEKFSQSKKDWWNDPEFGMERKKVQAQRRREQNLNRTYTDEQKHNLSMRMTGEGNHFYGKHHTDETKAKISKANKGRLAGGKNPAARQVICINTGEVFNCCKEAAEYAGVYDGSNIIRCCKGKNKTAGTHPITGERLQWKYYAPESVETAGSDE